MRLDEKQWHVRWFRWNQRVLDRFTDNDAASRYVLTMRGTNLCTYMRTILLGSMVATVSAAWWCGIAVLILLPFICFGLLGVGSALLIAVLVIGLLVGLVWVVVSGIPRTAEAVARMATPAEGQPVGFIACAWQWIRAAKQRICPLITFSGER